MGELLDYLLKNDPDFRKARLPSLYSDFRPQQTLNPDGYTANILAWRNALCLLARSHLITQSSPSSTTFTLDLDSSDSILRGLESRQFGQPLALGTVLSEAIARKEFIPLEGFKKAQTSVYTRTWGEVSWDAASWTLRTLGVTGGNRGEDRLPRGKYVLMEILESAAAKFHDQVAGRSSRFERVFTKSQFHKEFRAKLVPEQNLSEKDLDLLLVFLAREKGLIEYDGDTVRIKSTADQPFGILEEDRSMATLRELTASLQHQCDLLNDKIDSLSLQAKQAVSKNNKVTALAALKSRRIAESSLSTRYATLNQLEEVTSKLQQASDNVQLVKVMESSTGVLAKLNQQVGGAERVDGVIDALREEMSSADELGQILTEGSGEVLDEGELDDELEAMVAEEQKKEEDMRESKGEELAKKKLEQLPNVPNEDTLKEKRAETPTSETGIANLTLS